MAANGAPMLWIFHPVDQCPVTPRGFAQATSMFTRGESPKLAVNERDYFLGEIISVSPYCLRINVLVSTQGGKAVGKHDNTGCELVTADQPIQSLGQALFKIFPTDSTRATSRKTGQVK